MWGGNSGLLTMAGFRCRLITLPWRGMTPARAQPESRIGLDSASDIGHGPLAGLKAFGLGCAEAMMHAVIQVSPGEVRGLPVTVSLL